MRRILKITALCFLVGIFVFIFYQNRQSNDDPHTVTWVIDATVIITGGSEDGTEPLEYWYEEKSKNIFAGPFKSSEELDKFIHSLGLQL